MNNLDVFLKNRSDRIIMAPNVLRKILEQNQNHIDKLESGERNVPINDVGWTNEKEIIATKNHRELLLEALEYNSNQNT